MPVVHNATKVVYSNTSGGMSLISLKCMRIVRPVGCVTKWSLDFSLEPCIYLTLSRLGIMLVGGILVFNFLNDPPAMGYVVPITTVSLLLVPFNFRTARVLFIHWFSSLKFDPSAAAKHENS